MRWGEIRTYPLHCLWSKKNEWKEKMKTKMRTVSAVSTPVGAIKSSLESARRDLQIPDSSSCDLTFKTSQFHTISFNFSKCALSVLKAFLQNFDKRFVKFNEMGEIHSSIRHVWWRFLLRHHLWAALIPNAALVLRHWTTATSPNLPNRSAGAVSLSPYFWYFCALCAFHVPGKMQNLCGMLIWYRQA